ncbi:uncharacterized protein TNCV_4924841 [Trichonephila clavipes]|nr:uncharacterized protein TNCV_4924841 [Trichonephila clavipes]
MNSAPLTYPELYSICINNKQSAVPPVHHWYEVKRPGSSLSLQCSRQKQTIRTRFRSGHLQTLTFKIRTQLDTLRMEKKISDLCVRCSAFQTSSEHIPDGLGLSKQDLYEDHLIVLDFLRVMRALV